MVEKQEIRNGRVPSTVVRIELISYFLNNPDVTVTCDNIAREFAYPREQIEEQMGRLVELRIVKKCDIDGVVHYSYLPPFSKNILREKRLAIKDIRS